MAIYIYLFVQDIAIRCVQDFGCATLSNAHFTALLAGGFIETIFEIPLVIRIFKSRKDE